MNVRIQENLVIYPGGVIPKFPKPQPFSPASSWVENIWESVKTHDFSRLSTSDLVLSILVLLIFTIGLSCCLISCVRMLKREKMPEI